ncbi:hypothetical protein A9Y87_16360 [Salmonella enterica subsp. enterica]|nr:hypothetical protein A9Y87_16360 [Salmonella enterica subsp. enterica]
MLGNTIGPIAASVPLSVAAIAFYARLVDSALREVDKGIIEAALAFGASPMRIIFCWAIPLARLQPPSRCRWPQSRFMHAW